MFLIVINSLYIIVHNIQKDTQIILYIYYTMLGAWGSVVVKALRY